MLHDFFLHVLAKFPNFIAKARTARDLRNFVSRALTNLFIDCLRKAKHERSCDHELLACLVEERQQQLNRECPELCYADMLKVLTSWAATGTNRQQLRAEILQRVFVTGDRAEAIQHDLGISKSQFYLLRREALRELRGALTKCPP